MKFFYVLLFLILLFNKTIAQSNDSSKVENYRIGLDYSNLGYNIFGLSAFQTRKSLKEYEVGVFYFNEPNISSYQSSWSIVTNIGVNFFLSDNNKNDRVSIFPTLQLFYKFNEITSTDNYYGSYTDKFLGLMTGGKINFKFSKKLSLRFSLPFGPVLEFWNNRTELQFGIFPFIQFIF